MRLSFARYLRASVALVLCARLCPIAIAYFLAVAVTYAETIRVPNDHPTIQAAIDASIDGDVIEVGNGVYSGPGNRDLDFAGKAITLRSVHGVRKCTLKLDGDGDHRHRAFFFHSGETGSTIVEGFTISGGFADQHGGAIRLVGSSPTIRNCVFQEHEALGPSLGNLHGIASYWNFDDGGEYVADVISGNEIEVESVKWSDGMSGQSIAFSPNSGCSTIAASTDYRADDGLTISAWIKPNYNIEGTHTLLKANGRFSLGLKKGHVFATLTSVGGATRTVWGASLLPQNQWSHVTLKFDPDDHGVAADLNSFNGLRRDSNSPGLSAGAPGEWDNHIREIGNVLYEPDELNPARRYKLFYSGYSGAYAGNNVYVGWAYSEDGLHWTKAGKVHPRPLEDPYVVKRGNVYYLYAEDKADVPFRNIRLLQSFNCNFWSDEDDVFDIAVGGTPFNWESSDVSSPVVWVEGETWYLMYEGRGGGLSGRVGLATSTDGRNWQRIPGGAPVFTNGDPGQWDESNVVTDEVIKIDSTYYFFYHGFGRTQSSGFWTGLATSTDLLHWTRYPFNPISPSETVMVLKDDHGMSLFAVNVDESGITRNVPAVVSGPRLFVNGREESYWQRDDTNDEPAVSETGPIHMGCDPADWRRQYVGAVDELRIYPRPLSAAELKDPIQSFVMPLGGAVSCESGSNPVFSNCVFFDNQSASAGGAVYADAASAPRFINCTLADNTANAGRGGGAFVQGAAQFSNSILWGNQSTISPVQIAGTAEVFYCDVDDEIPGATNMRANPRFVDEGRRDYHLQRNSACINGGASGVGLDSDLDGKDRIMCGQVDIGAYEYGVGDPNCDQQVDLIDYESFFFCLSLPKQGNLPSNCKTSDFDNDGDVDLGDFSLFGVSFSAMP